MPMHCPEHCFHVHSTPPYAAVKEKRGLGDAGSRTRKSQPLYHRVGRVTDPASPVARVVPRRPWAAYMGAKFQRGRAGAARGECER
jgi:hypothetical protein